MKKLIILVLGMALLPSSSGAQNSSSIDLKNLFGDLRARHIGPALMSGRINDMEVHPTNNQIIYAGTACLLYTSPSPRDRQKSRMPSSA